MKKIFVLSLALVLAPLSSFAIGDTLVLTAAKSAPKSPGWSVVAAGILLDEESDLIVHQGHHRAFNRANLARELQRDCRVAETDAALMAEAELGRIARSFDLFKEETAAAGKVKALCKLFDNVKISAAAAHAEDSRYRVGLAYEAAGTTKLSERDERLIKNLYAILAVF